MSNAPTSPGLEGPTLLPIGSANTDNNPRARRRGRAPDFGAKSNPTRPPLTADRRDLAARYMPLAGAMARRAAVGWSSGSAHELRSAAALALVESAGTFDESRGVDFSTFARHRIRGALADARRREGCSRIKYEAVPLEIPVGCGGSRGGLCGMTEDEDVGSELEREEAVESCIRRLSAMQARAVRLVYFAGVTQEEAARLMGLSKATMHRIHRGALERLAAMRGRLLAAG